MSDDLKKALAPLLHSSIAVASEPIADFSAELYPEEKKLMQDVSSKRMNEFSTGRHCAKTALATINAPKKPILMGEEREPKWPDGYTGSISHSHDIALAIATPKQNILSLGIDIERRNRLEPKLWKKIYTAEEREKLSQLPEKTASDHATIGFAAKEAFYKFQYTLTKAWLGFGDAEVQIIDDSTLSLQIIGKSSLEQKTYTGHYLMTKCSACAVFWKEN